MAPFTTVPNQFRGINPHLNSRLQIEGGWDSFHVNHISDLTRLLQRDLRGMGYIAQAAQSLQIRRRDELPRTPESDVTVYDPSRRPAGETATTGAFALSVPELLSLDEEDLATYRAVGVYRKVGGDGAGDAVAWLELLSPANKPGGRHHAAYRDKRLALLQAGLVFIELDYLHHQPPTVTVPAYPAGPGSSAFRILVIDPRPDWLHGAGQVYPVHVDEPLPTLDIPLNARDVLRFDFDAAYQQTFTGLFFGDNVDYSTLPPGWAHYSDADQARILSRLLAVRSGESAGITGLPPPVEPLPLEAAWAQWTR